MTSHGVADRAIRLVARVGAAIGSVVPPRILQPLLVAVGTVAAVSLWPWLAVRRRAAAAGLAVSPWAWGASMGRMLGGLLQDDVGVEVDGWDEAVASAGSRGVLVLGGHLGPWEAAAAELARRGRPPTVVAAPWPGLHRAEEWLRVRRSRRGVTGVPRGRAGLRTATESLRRGGTVVVLVDGVSPDRAGRRACPWVLGRLGAPDALIAWALRHGAAVWVAEGRPRGVTLHVLAPAADPERGEPGRVRSLSDRAVALLDAAVRRRPEAWAWVRPLALLMLGLSLGCGADLPEPLPLQADAWDAEVVDLAWDGEIRNGEGSGPARFFAESAVVRWVDGAPEGRFRRVEITAPRADGEPSSVRIEAATANGRWPDGPLRLQDVRWEAVGVPAGRLPVLAKAAGGAWDCGGCDLEELLAIGGVP